MIHIRDKGGGKVEFAWHFSRETMIFLLGELPEKDGTTKMLRDALLASIRAEFGHVVKI